MSEFIRKFTGYKERRAIAFAVLLLVGLHTFPPTNGLVATLFSMQSESMPYLSVPFIFGLLTLVISFMIFREVL